MTSTSTQLSLTLTSTSTSTSTLSSNAASILSLFITNNSSNNILTLYTGDLSSCLANCSNQGVCFLNSENKYACKCDKFKIGVACQSDTRSCASGPCLNNATCTNINNETTFMCTCQSNLYVGIHCENKVNLCTNSTICTPSQGYCIMNETQPSCKCFAGYTGAYCEIMSTSLAVRKSVISVTTIITITVLVSFVVLVIFFDYTKYCLTKKRKKNFKEHSEIKRFHYYTRSKSLI